MSAELRVPRPADPDAATDQSAPALRRLGGLPQPLTTRWELAARRLRAGWLRRTNSAPLLSVVVPVYNVAEYLGACLDSIAQQAVEDLEVIVVDDGSTDGCAAIAESFVRRDARFRLIQQQNHGLGHARNAGARQARGTYLAFADSDDIVTPQGYRTLISHLERSGSDFASGNARRLTASGTGPVKWLSPAFTTTRVATHITRDSTLMIDRVAWNKVFRRSFWTSHRLTFAEGVFYEDIPVILPAHFQAKSVDVVKDTVYLWRWRPGGERSITQDRLGIAGLRDRLRAVTEVHRFIGEHSGRRQQRIFAETTFDSDLRPFLAALPRADDEYRAEFITLVNEYMDEVDPHAADALPAIDRLSFHFVRHRDLDRLLKVLSLGGDELSATEVVRRGNGWYARYPFFGDAATDAPDHLYRLSAELKLRTGVTEVAWVDGQLHLEGHAYIDLIDLPDGSATDIRMQVVHTVTGVRRGVALTQVQRPEVTREADQPTRCYDWAGFAAVLDPDELPGIDARTGSWVFEMEVATGGVTRQGRLANPAGGRDLRAKVLARVDGTRLRAYMDSQGLCLGFDDLSVTLTEHDSRQGHLLLSGTTSLEPEAAPRLRLTSRELGRSIQVPVTTEHSRRGPLRWMACVPLATLVDVADSRRATSGHATWRIAMMMGGRRPTPVAFPTTGGEACYASSDHREVTLRQGHRGTLILLAGAPRPVVETYCWEGDDLCLEGRWRGDHAADGELVLASARQAERRCFPLHRRAGRFRARLPLARMPSLAGALPLAAGRWDVLVRDASTELSPLMVDQALLDRFPTERMVAAKRIQLQGPSDRLVLQAGRDLAADETGRRAQHLLQTRTYPRQRQLPLLDVVLYSSFAGKQYSDSPRAIHEEITARGTGLDHAWVVRDGQVALPETARPVPQGGRVHHELLGRARFIVVNSHLPSWFRRREGQVVLQTWHGSALKKIGLDIERIHFPNPAYQENLRSETAQWTYLVSPNPANSQIMARAFACQGRLLETGYPRNDVLLESRTGERAERIRRRLNLPPDRTVVLYAPTWRDDRHYWGRGSFQFDMRLDVGLARRALGDSHVLLVRRHPNIVDAYLGADGCFARDVSLYPDMSELLLVADILVTDYSATMFDFAVTGRPMLFFTYDLEHYRDTLRGFYLDFEARAPGPLLKTSDEVVAAIRDAEAVRQDHDMAYRRFADEFTPWDDGHASRRVVNALLDTCR